jgi:hypothetical protein
MPWSPCAAQGIPVRRARCPCLAWNPAPSTGCPVRLAGRTAMLHLPCLLAGAATRRSNHSPRSATMFSLPQAACRTSKSGMRIRRPRRSTRRVGCSRPPSPATVDPLPPCLTLLANSRPFPVSPPRRWPKASTTVCVHCTARHARRETVTYWPGSTHSPKLSMLSKNYLAPLLDPLHAQSTNNLPVLGTILSSRIT